MTSRPRALPALALALLALAAPALARAQGHGGGGIGGGMGHGPFGPGGGNNPYSPGLSRPNSPADAPMGHERGNRDFGLQLGPPGRWWDDGKFAQSIGLDPRQQQRMDDIFGENKGNLVRLYKNLQHEQSQLSKAVRARELDEAAIFQQIDRVAQARGELEKANAHMLLQLRKELTPEQTARLDDHRPDQ